MDKNEKLKLGDICLAPKEFFINNLGEHENKML